MEEIERVVNALKRIRTGLVIDEHKLHQTIAAELAAAGIPFQHEVKLAPRNRIDFLTDSGIGIEVKKGKPYSEAVLQQLERYAGFEKVKGIILVIERYQDVPEEINGKTCRSVGLRRLWGIASN